MDARKDALNKLTACLVRAFGVIHVEDLSLHGMVRVHALAGSLSNDPAQGLQLGPQRPPPVESSHL